MDPIMWDPFRYKLGGRLLNGKFEEFIHNYGGPDSGVYTAKRDIASYALIKEGGAGRGVPSQAVAHTQRVVGATRPRRFDMPERGDRLRTPVPPASVRGGLRRHPVRRCHRKLDAGVAAVVGGVRD